MGPKVQTSRTASTFGTMLSCCMTGEGEAAGGTAKSIELVEPQIVVGTTAPKKKKAQMSEVPEPEEDERDSSKQAKVDEVVKFELEDKTSVPDKSTVQKICFQIRYVYALDDRSQEVELRPYDAKSAIVMKVSGEPANTIPIGTRILAVGGKTGSFDEMVEALRFHGLHSLIVEHPVRMYVTFDRTEELGIKWRSEGRMLQLTELSAGPVLDWNEKNGNAIRLGDLICEVSGISGSPTLMAEAFKYLKKITIVVLHYDVR